MDSDYHLVSFYLITGKIFKANMLGNCWKLIYPPFKPRYPPRGGRRNSIKTIISITLWHLKYTHTQHTRTQSLQSNSNNFFKKRRRWYVTKGKTIFQVGSWKKVNPDFTAVKCSCTSLQIICTLKPWVHCFKPSNIRLLLPYSYRDKIYFYEMP